MKKFLKIVGIVVVVLLLLLIFTPMLFKGKITELVKKEANEMLVAKLDFRSLDISLLRHFPHASVELKGLTLINDAPFEGDTLVSADRISVVVNLMSLFGDGGYEVTKVILASPSVLAQKNAGGAVSWNIMKPSTEPEAETPADTTASSFKLMLKDLQINDARIRYADDSTGMYFATAPLTLRLSGDMTADETDLALQLNAKGLRFVSGGVALLSNDEAELDATVAADMKNSKYTLTNTTLRLNAISLGLDGWVQMLPESVIAMDLKAGTDKVQFKDVLSLIPALYTNNFDDLKASGSLSLSLWAKGTMQGNQLPAFEVKLGVDNGSFQYASLPQAVDNINIALGVTNPGGSMDKTAIDLSKLTLRMAGNDLSASLSASNLVSDLTFKAAVNGKVDFGALHEVYPLDEGVDLSGILTADLTANGRMSDIENQRYENIGAKGTFVIENLALKTPSLPAVNLARLAATITPQAMSLDDCNVTIGRSDVQAKGSLTGYLGYLLRGDMLTGKLAVNSKLLDLNEIMGAMPADSTATAEPAEQAAAPADTTGSSLTIPKNLNLTLTTSMQQILFQKMQISQLSGAVSVANQAVSLNNLALQLFNGKATASGSLSTADAAHPALKMNVGLSNASFEETFKELDMVQKLVPIFAKTGGNYSLSLDMTSKLDAAMNPDLNSVNATGELKSADINIQNIEAFSALAKALKNDKLSQIQAKDVDIKFAIKDGRITTQPFDLSVAGIKMNLAGSTGLDQTIDYTAKVSLPSGATNGILQDVNVGIGGTFSAPKISLDMKDAAKEAAKNAVDQGIQKLTGSASLSDEIQKQADNLRATAKAAGQKLVDAAQQQSDKLVSDAASKGTVAKLAAQAAGKKLVEAAQKQADKLTADAETKINDLEAKATAKTE